MSNEKARLPVKTLPQFGSSFLCLFNRKKQPTKAPQAVSNEFEIHKVPGLNFEELSEKELRLGTWFVMSFPREKYEKEDGLLHSTIIDDVASAYSAANDSEKRGKSLEFIRDCHGGIKTSWAKVIFELRGRCSSKDEIDILFYSPYPKADFVARLLKGELANVLQASRESAYTFINAAHDQWQSLNNNESAQAIKEGRKGELIIHLEDVCDDLFSVQNGTVKNERYVPYEPTNEASQLMPST